MNVIRVSSGIPMLLVILISLNLTAQQPAVQLTKNQFEGFRYVLTYLTRADVNKLEANQRLNNIAFQFRLSDAEAAVLRATAESYRQTISAFLLEATGQQADEQAQTRDAAVRSRAAGLLQQLPPLKREKILAQFEDPSITE